MKTKYFETCGNMCMKRKIHLQAGSRCPDYYPLSKCSEDWWSPRSPKPANTDPALNKPPNDTLWIQLWPVNNKSTAQDTSEHSESFSVFHVRLTQVPSKTPAQQMFFRQF